MAMGWLKGLVAPVAFGEQGAQQPPGMGPGGPPPGGPPIGGMPPAGGSPYGVAPAMPGMGGMPGMGPPPGAQPMAQPMGGAQPYDPSALGAMQWSTGTRTQGSAQGAGAPAGLAGAGAPAAGLAGPLAGAGIAGAAQGAPGAPGSLEARCVQLQHDVDSLALFARTLLTMLEENKVVTREQFDATKTRLDMLDGKLDDR
jgi:hypothetical protein